MAVNKSNSNSSRLNQNQLLFANLYFKSGNATKSYQQAYGETNEDAAAANASRLIGNDKVKAYLDLMRSKVENASIATVTEVQEELTRFMSDIELSPKDRLKAMDMLIHSQGGYKDNIDVGSTEVSAIKIKFVNKSLSNTKKETDPKIVGEYTPPSNSDES